MTAESTVTSYPAPSPTRVDLLAPPAWVGLLLNGAPNEFDEAARGAVFQRRAAGEFLWLELTVPGASELSEAEFHKAVVRAYERLGETLRQRRQHPIRLWNYLPQIRTASHCGFTRYEVFNRARREGYAGWHGAPLEGALPASTGVGHRHSADYIVQVLAASRAGSPVENPRQCPAYRYSQRYGPVPPSFARAVIVRGHRWGTWAVLSGTASIVGEDSRHPGNLSAQLGETLANLSSLVQVAAVRAGIAAGVHALEHCREIRAYIAQDVHVGCVSETLEGIFGMCARIEIVAADLCRPELLVEVEGIADLNRTPPVRR